MSGYIQDNSHGRSIGAMRLRCRTSEGKGGRLLLWLTTVSARPFPQFPENSSHRCRPAAGPPGTPGDRFPELCHIGKANLTSGEEDGARELAYVECEMDRERGARWCFWFVLLLATVASVCSCVHLNTRPTPSSLHPREAKKRRKQVRVAYFVTVVSPNGRNSLLVLAGFPVKTIQIHGTVRQLPFRLSQEYVEIAHSTSRWGLHIQTQDMVVEVPNDRGLKSRQHLAEISIRAYFLRAEGFRTPHP